MTKQLPKSFGYKAQDKGVGKVTNFHSPKDSSTRSVITTTFVTIRM